MTFAEHKQLLGAAHQPHLIPLRDFRDFLFVLERFDVLVSTLSATVPASPVRKVPPPIAKFCRTKSSSWVFRVATSASC